jgi:pimeloyl-ACP methyl ester carboxylesterase
MKTPADGLYRSAATSAKVGQVLTKRLQLAQRRCTQEVHAAWERSNSGQATTPWALWQAGAEYALDFAQRSVLFWDTLRQRGNNYVEHERAGKPPLLHFEYETLLDGRKLSRPVNYALVRIVPPAGVSVDPKRRPYVIIDPRAGHGPGIGGFKDDSQVGVALREGHPVYFVIFYPEPEPGQTLLDVCAAEREFVRHVRGLHPASPKPVVVGNCQGGWAAMMLAASDPENTGAIVINGAPMSYWGGAWQEGEGDNPMRYAGGLLGGSWIASFVSDLSNGRFDGAWLVQNFESLNPANTWWTKYHNLFANVDTEPPRFLEFERWWGGFYLMNREEIEWITQNLFVGNKAWSGTVSGGAGESLDLRNIRAPIILFASMGDNITPPQQAFNWVGDVYRSTEEIKARGQVIVGLLHEDVGHLGIFVSGKVAKKEHAQIVSVLRSIEALPPGLYGMKIAQQRNSGGKPEYSVEFVEHRLEDILQRLNRFQRMDEKPFRAVAAFSEFNQRAYELFVRPWVQAAASEGGARTQLAFHPLRAQRWLLSDLNPFLWWLPHAAAAVKAQRSSLSADAPARRAERLMSECTVAALDYYRDVRDALSESAFFQIYGNLFNFYLADQPQRLLPVDATELPVVKDALATIDQGGYPEAVARVAALLARGGEPLPLERLHLRHELLKEYRGLLPDGPPDAQRRIRGEQDIIVRYEPQRAVETLPLLIAAPADRKRLLELLERVMHDERIQGMQPTPEQFAMVEKIKRIAEVAH